MLAVSCRQVVKEFGEGQTRVRVLHGVDLEIPAGELTMLVGPSGCGKTTLISIIAGILSFESGTVELFGQDLSQLKSADLVRFRRRTLGFIFQQYNLLPALSAAENAAVPLLAAGMARSAAVGKARDLLARLGLGEHLGKLPNQLSGGQQQRVAIARALVHEPKLIVCDEPTAALDAGSGQTVMGLLRDAAVAADRGVIVVTHDNRIYRYADRIAEMSDGRITSVDTPQHQKVA